MKRRICAFLLCIILTELLFPAAALADTGPKPSVRITFENMGSEVCYGTLLSRTSSTGPASAWDGDEASAFYNGLDPEIWKAFVEYQDSDGYYFLQTAWLCSETKRLDWTYYPPYAFKILLYYPESEAFIVSEACECYAFDSYYTVDMDGIEIADIAPDAPAEFQSVRKSYDYTWELISLAVRIALTILIEIGIALIFGFRQGRLLKLILIVNIITQVILNVLLNFIDYSLGPLVLIFSYIALELLVFIAESVIYCLLFDRFSRVSIPKWKAIVYSLAANAGSFAAGLLIAAGFGMVF